MTLKLSFICLLLFLVAFCSFDARAQIQFDRPKTARPLDNPYTLGVPREQILQTIREVIKTCAIQIDDTLSKPSDGKIITKSVVFTRGVTTKADLEHLAVMPAGEGRNWEQGRFHLGISALPLHGKRSQLLAKCHTQYTGTHAQGARP